MNKTFSIFMAFIVLAATGPARVFGARGSDSYQQAYEFFERGADQYAKGYNVDAIRNLEEALYLNPRLDSARGILLIALAEEALMEYHDGQYQEALPHLNKLLRLLPDDEEIQQLYQQVRDKQRSEKITINVVDHTTDLHQRYNLDWMGYLGLGNDLNRIDERIRYLEKMFVSYSGTIFGTKQIEEELARLSEEKKIALASLSPQDRFSRAVDLFKEDRFVEALELFSSIDDDTVEGDIKRYRTETEIALENRLQQAIAQARAMEHIDQYKEALEAWGKVFAIDSSERTARLAIKEINTKLGLLFNEGITSYQDGAYREALQFWEELRKIYPGYRHVQEYITQARRMLKVAQLEPQLIAQIEYHIRRGDSFQRSGKFIAAVREWRTVFELDPRNKLAQERIANLLASLYKRGQTTRKQGDLKTAKKIFNLIVSIDPTYKDAKQKMVTTVKKKSVDIDSIITRAQNEYQSGNYLEGLALLKKVLGVESTNKQAIALASECALSQGILLYRSDKLSEAIKQWDFVLRYYPSHEKAQKYRERAQLKLQSIQKLK
ncbi:MAG: hypothetical protein GF384_06465 [Elusimicrobia bacterium]|nr:hypothetical protein [Elusimicrobiota bacterium]MBD3412359.1 hypothetical protein [Elusimicrobiota bacterium]